MAASPATIPDVANRATELTTRDGEILAALTGRVRVLTIGQVARTWWGETSKPEANATRRLRSLEDSGLVTVQSLISHPELELPGPVAAWQRGMPDPAFPKLARALSRRWTEPERATPCVVATAQAAAQFGGTGGRLPRDSEATHDIHFAAVYLRMVQELPTRARTWTPEAALKKGQGVKVPDALVRDGKYTTAIEFGGSYSGPKLAAFHGYCQGRALAYELW